MGGGGGRVGEVLGAGTKIPKIRVHCTSVQEREKTDSNELQGSDAVGSNNEIDAEAGL